MIHFSKAETALLASILLVVLMVGCTPRVLQSGLQPAPLAGVPALVSHIALVFAGMATVSLFLCGIAAFLTKNILACAKYACIAFAVLIIAGLLHALALHWKLAMGLSGLVLVAGLVGFGWLHRKDIEKRLGLS